MYEEYWELREKPFENTPDPKFFYYSPQHSEGLARLLYCIREQKGAGMLSGVFGCGKTLVGKTVLRELSKDVYKTAFVINPQMEEIELLMSIATTLGIKGLPEKKTEVLTNVVLERLNEVLQNNLRDGKKTVVIIDEAHVIEKRSVWEALRLILNFQLEDRFLLTLLLLGQPELKELIDNYKQLSQRIAIRCNLANLTSEDTLKYILHRLKVTAGGEKERMIFNDGALRLIYEKSGGIPRRINHICDLALLVGFSRQVREINEALIIEVSADFEA